MTREAYAYLMLFLSHDIELTQKKINNFIFGTWLLLELNQETAYRSFIVAFRYIINTY